MFIWAGTLGGFLCGVFFRQLPLQCSVVPNAYLLAIALFEHIPFSFWTTPGKTSNDFKYLTTHAPAEDMDFTGLAEVQDAIRELGIITDEERDVFKALAGLLHLGQVKRQYHLLSNECFFRYVSGL